MIGAILGDIIGSRFEFNPTFADNFELLTPKNTFTDDTILMVAVADALMNDKDMAETLKEWYLKYPKKPFGPNFSRWGEGLKVSRESIGNGAMMRLGALPFLYANESDILRAGKDITELTHNTEEALISVEVMLRYAFNLKGASNKNCLPKEFNLIPKADLSFNDLWLRTRWSAKCYDTLPQAIASFKESKSFEDAIRKAVSMGSDSDTMAAITGIFAEAYYGLEEFDREHDIENILYEYLDNDIIRVLQQYMQFRLHGRK